MKREKIYLSTIATDAVRIAREHGFGLEIAEYCTAWNMDEKFVPVHGVVKKKLEGICTSKHFGCEITVCDVGVNADIKEQKVLNRKIAYGTQNIVHGPAMTREQAVQAMMTGIELAQKTDADVIGIGKMGIGNTTTSSAVLSVLLDADVEAVTGRGGGITDAGFLKKKQVITDAIAINQPDKCDVIDVLAKVGGFHIAAMCGAFIGVAASHRPVVIDYCGSTDLPLSESGRAELLHRSCVVVGEVRYVTSGMQRCNETLQILFGKVPYKLEQDLCEIDFGEFEMKSYEQLKNDFAFQAWISDDHDANIAPGGESGNQMRARALAAYRRIINEGEDTVIVTHGGVIAAIMADLYPNESKNRYEWQPSPGSGYVISDGTYQLL